MKTFTILLWIMFVLTSCQVKEADGKWRSLFDGRTLDGWEISNTTGGNVNIENGSIELNGSDVVLFYDGRYRNFEFEALVKSGKDAIGGILFHTQSGSERAFEEGYAIQINNNHIGRLGRKTGSICKVRNIYYPIVENDEWFKIRIKVVENHIQVYINNRKVNDYVEPENPWRWEGAELVRTGIGTIALQSEDAGGSLWYKELRIREIPESEPREMVVSEDWDKQVTRLMSQGFPLVDYHVHLKGGLTLGEVVDQSQKLGINYGIAPNCGLHFPVTNDSSLYAYFEGVKEAPVYKGMQAEGREWVTLFSPEAIAGFDYVFTDAMTFTDDKGRRNRIWIPEEVWVDDKKQFMDQLVAKIEAIFSLEPVDIYVNPTVLPDVLMNEYDELWTEDRKQRVINVLAENDVALEINARYRLPKPDMIKMAKEAGIKFTFGTNNTGRNLGKLDYCLEMIEECDLSPENMFEIKPDTLKPINVKGLPQSITG
ncbi:DUF1080 domain-containing protein [Marinilabilia salmonicolor]|uniref:DUF1080 domain-containing protein n=1 Tax=Marinilabilia salmonicolor TaxID=989 RepID=UPI000315EE65|nr:family 16 glycoside hydrolase [Marinilabilia salmonicolor]